MSENTVRIIVCVQDCSAGANIPDAVAVKNYHVVEVESEKLRKLLAIPEGYLYRSAHVIGNEPVRETKT